jgi:hypothetical protein
LELGFVLLVGALTASAIASANHQSLKIQLGIVFCFAFSLSLHIRCLKSTTPPKESNPQIQLYYWM